jgi:hypothetical protein
MHEMSIGTEAEPLLGKHFDTQVKSSLLLPSFVFIGNCPSWHMSEKSAGIQSIQKVLVKG